MTSHEIDIANHRRDARLRRRLLQVLHAARTRPQSGWTSAWFVLDVVDAASPPAMRFESPEHFLGLMRDLVSRGYVQERDERTHAWQTPGLEFTCFRITAQGTALVHEAAEPDPLVEDARVMKDQC